MSPAAAVGLACATFASGAALDFADASYTRAVAQARPHAAARWSIAMYVLGLVGFYGILRIAPWLAIFEAGGLYLGSWLAVRGRRPARGARPRERNLL